MPKCLAAILAIFKSIDFEVITAVVTFCNFWKHLGYFLSQHLVTLVANEIA